MTTTANKGRHSSGQSQRGTLVTECREDEFKLLNENLGSCKAGRLVPGHETVADRDTKIGTDCRIAGLPALTSAFWLELLETPLVELPEFALEERGHLNQYSMPNRTEAECRLNLRILGDVLVTSCGCQTEPDFRTLAEKRKSRRRTMDEQYRNG